MKLLDDFAICLVFSVALSYLGQVVFVHLPHVNWLSGALAGVIVMKILNRGERK